jgi:hypothetical protein
MKIIRDNINKNISRLINSKWFKNSSIFLLNKNNINISNVFIEPITKEERFNIYLELYEFLQPEILKQYIPEPEYMVKYLSRLRTTLATVNKFQELRGKSSKSLNYRLRDLLDINENGELIKKQFFAYLKTTAKLDKQSELLLNPFTSLLNLNEIYLQSDYHISFEATLEYDNVIYHLNVNDIIIYTHHKHYIVDAINNLDSFSKGILEKENGNGNEIKNTNKKQINELFRNIASRVFLIQYLAGGRANTTPPETIIMYLINYNKQFMEYNDKKIKFTSNEINTGVTDGREIIITRGEEAMRTILHECIHFYNLDFKGIPSYISEWIFNNFNIVSNSNTNHHEGDIYIFEAYTEFVASILHLLTKAVKWKLRADEAGKKNTIELMNKQFITLFTKQVIYTYTKFCQILAYSKCTSFSQFYKGSSSKNIRHKDKKNIKNKTNKPELVVDKCILFEDTNVFCYYYLKLTLYLNIPSILQIMDKTNAMFLGRNIDAIEFKKLLNIFKKFSDNDLFCECMNKTVGQYNNKFKKLQRENINGKDMKDIQTLKMIFID